MVQEIRTLMLVAVRPSMSTPFCIHRRSIVTTAAQVCATVSMCVCLSVDVGLCRNVQSLRGDILPDMHFRFVCSLPKSLLLPLHTHPCCTGKYNPYNRRASCLNCPQGALPLPQLGRCAPRTASHHLQAAFLAPARKAAQREYIAHMFDGLFLSYRCYTVAPLGVQRLRAARQPARIALRALTAHPGSCA